jgi:adenylate cyclase
LVENLDTSNRDIPLSVRLRRLVERTLDAADAGLKVLVRTLKPRLLAVARRLRRVNGRDLRLASGLVLFAYLTSHLSNHAIGLISLEAAEAGLVMTAEYWSSWWGTRLLYGAFAVHFLLAFWSIYERRTFRLPPLELLRIGLGLWLPVVLFGHFTATRLEFELLGSDPTYQRIVAALWGSDSEWRQIGVLAPGWLHGCLGLYFAFGHKPLFRRFQYLLFAIALLLPVLSALGFLTMARDIARNAAVPGVEISEPMSPEALKTQETMKRWLNGILWGYFGLIGATFAARGVRLLVERHRRGLIKVAYPNRTVQVPRGWSVLEASRAFHIAHASVCGGRARCSTCRVRVNSGAEDCPPPQPDERATLERIAADPDVRLACQLRPQGNIAVSPLVLSERPIYRARPVTLESERDVVLLYCDFTNSEELVRDHMAHDVLFAFKRYAESACHAIRSAGGTICYVDRDSIFALFGLSGDLERACRSALTATAEIDQSLREINDRLGQEWGCRADIAVSIHAGRVALSKIGQTTDLIIAAGDAVEVASEIRKTAMAERKLYAVSNSVFAAAKVEPPAQDSVTVAAGHDNASLPVYLMDTVETQQDAALRRRIRRAATKVVDRIRG